MSKNSRGKIRKPNGFLYFIAYSIAYPFLKIVFHLKVDRSLYNPPKGPFVVISNHESFMDFLLVMLAVYPHRLNAVAAQKYFHYRPLNWLLPLMGAIPKYLFETDLRAILAIMKVVKQGGQLLLFPEGRDSVHGPYMGMNKATGKLIKALQVPVLSCNIEGSYNCMPFWRKTFRRGRIRIRLADLFSVRDTQTLSIAEINSRIDARLSGVEAQLLSESSLKPTPDLSPGLSPGSSRKPLTLFRARRLAEGLENILYYCPVCQQEFTLETTGNTISCRACGSAATMDCSANLLSSEKNALPKTVADWYTIQVLHEKSLLKEGAEYLRAEVNVMMPLDKGRGFTQRGQGELWLDSTGWYFDGELFGESSQLFFPIDTVPAVPFEPNDNIQICAKGNFYIFAPIDNPRASAKYATIGECVYWSFASPVQMTPGKNSGFCDERRVSVGELAATSHVG